MWFSVVIGDGIMFFLTHILQGEIKLERQQILSLFIKSMKKLHKYLYGIASKEIESTLPRLREVSRVANRRLFLNPNTC